MDDEIGGSRILDPRYNCSITIRTGWPGRRRPDAVVDLGPDADLAGDRIDLGADERNFAVEGGGVLAREVEREPHRCAEQLGVGRGGRQESFGLEALRVDDPQRLLARLDPFAEADEDLHDRAVERRDDLPADALDFRGVELVLRRLHFERGDLLVVVGLLGFEPRLLDVEPFDVELRLRDALGEASDRVGRPLELGLGDLGRLVGVADLHVVRGLLVGDVVLQLGGQLGHPRDLVVDLSQHRSFLHASPSRTATLVSTPASCAGTSASANSRSTTDCTSSGLVLEAVSAAINGQAIIKPEIITQRRRDAERTPNSDFSASLRLCERISAMYCFECIAIRSGAR